MPLTGEQYEALDGLVYEYELARSAEGAAAERKASSRAQIMGILKAASESAVTVGEFRVTASAVFREAIPLHLARQLLDVKLLKQLIQTTSTVQLRITKDKGQS